MGREGDLALGEEGLLCGVTRSYPPQARPVLVHLSMSENGTNETITSVSPDASLPNTCRFPFVTLDSSNSTGCQPLDLVTVGMKVTCLQVVQPVLTLAPYLLDVLRLWNASIEVCSFMVH